MIKESLANDIFKNHIILINYTIPYRGWAKSMKKSVKQKRATHMDSPLFVRWLYDSSDKELPACKFGTALRVTHEDLQAFIESKRDNE